MQSFFLRGEDEEMTSKKQKLIDDLKTCLLRLQDQAIIENSQEELQMWQDLWGEIQDKIAIGTIC